VTIVWYRTRARGILANREGPVCGLVRRLACKDYAQIPELRLYRVLVCWHRHQEAPIMRAAAQAPGHAR
jgi:hypothetical protein